MHRRAFVSGLFAGTIAALPLPAAQDGGAQDSSDARVRVQVQPNVRLGSVPEDFTGLGYEISSVAEPGLLAASNQAYVQFVRTLGRGVIRIGGNTSDYGSWSADGSAVSSPKATVVNRSALLDLAGFLRATGWRLIWGLNLGQGNIDQAVDEAAAVSESMGESLLAFEIGNEPDMFAGVHRAANYSYADWHSEYLRFKGAIRDKLPNSRFAGPDVFMHTEWLEQFAATEGADVQLLTHHHYPEGPPDSPASTIENLLRPNEILTNALRRIEAASRSARVPYRFCEVNSCFGGGKPGVSDTMAAALWGLDLMFTLGQFNAAGVNFETGINQLGFFSWYSPIGMEGQRFRAQPLYYGMLAFRVATHGERIGVSLERGGLNISAYAARSNGDVWLTLINKEAARDARVQAACPGTTKASALRLTAASLSSKDGVLLGGSAVSSTGEWQPGPRETVSVVRGEMEIHVPAASAALIQLR